MRIRRAVPDDADAIAAIDLEIAQQGRFVPSMPDEIRPAAWQRERIARDDRGMVGWFVAEDDADKIVGFLCIRRYDTRAADHVGELGLGVATAHRGVGVGARLIQAAEAWARVQGIEKVCLGVFADNERARRLYERLGYGVEGVRRRHYRLDDREVDEILMAKWLAADVA